MTPLSEAADAVRAIADLEDRGRAAVALFTDARARAAAAREILLTARITRKNRADRAPEGGLPEDVAAADQAAVDGAQTALIDAQADVGEAFELLRDTLIGLLRTGRPADDVANVTGAPAVQVLFIARLDQANTQTDDEVRVRGVSELTAEVWAALEDAWERRMLAALDLHHGHGKSIRDLVSLLQLPVSTVTNMRERAAKKGVEIPHRGDSEALALDANADVVALEPVADWALELRQDAVLDTLAAMTDPERKGGPLGFGVAWDRLAALTGLSVTRLKLIRRPLVGTGKVATAQKAWQRILPSLRTIVEAAAPGTRLPGEWELARQLGRESRTTISYALHALAGEGLVEARRGIGWFTTTEEQRNKPDDDQKAS